MTDIAQLIVDQNLRIEAHKKAFADAASSFARLCDAGEAVQGPLKKDALLSLYQKAKAYFCCVENCIVEGCVAGAFEHSAWLDDMSDSSEKVLGGLTVLYGHFRRHRSELGFKAGTFEPTGNIFKNMQGILALCRPEKAKELKEQLINVKLPHDGFDKPLKPKPMKPEKNNPWTAGSFYLVVCAVVVVGLIFAVRFLPGWAIAPVFIASILLVIVIGVLQLKNDDRLKDKSFVELMKLVMKRLFLFKGPKGDGSGS